MTGSSQFGALVGAGAWPRLTRSLAAFDWRRVAASYAHVLAGTFGRLGLQAVYFLILANTLSLGDMGWFAAASAAGIILGSVAALGFPWLAFRAAARRRNVGAHLAMLYAALVVTLPFGLGAALLVYAAAFDGALPLTAFLAIVASEAVGWRVAEATHQVNNGLGRYVAGSLGIVAATAARTLAAVLFALGDAHDLSTWAVLFLAANGISLAASLTLFRPPVRLRWHAALFVGRLRSAALLCFVALVWDLQRELDKIIIVMLTNDRLAGLYAIATRVIELASVPVKAFLVLYSRRLLRQGSRAGVMRRNLPVELGIAAVALVSFLAFVSVMTMRPGLLGANIGAALQLYGLMLLVPVFKNLMDLHAELTFADGEFARRARLVTALVVVKCAGLALLALATPDVRLWGLWLNGIFATLYLVSAWGTYWTFRQAARAQPETSLATS